MRAPRRPVFLIGLPACGKTTLGRAVAARRPDIAFADLDAEVEKAEGMSVASIFGVRGEEAFRRAESRALRTLCGRGDVLVACGGGTPCHGDNMDAMLAAGTVVLLDASRERLLRRLAEASPGQRPMFADGDAGAVLDALAGRRADSYRRAHATFDSTYLDTEAEVEATAGKFIDRFL